MSSEIVPGLDTMALGRARWHDYGTVVGSSMSYAEALSIADLDWLTRLGPLTTITPNGVVEVDTHRATYRSDTGAVLGADYHPHQPSELLELIHRAHRISSQGRRCPSASGAHRRRSSSAAGAVATTC